MGKHQAKHFLALTKRVQLMQMHEGAENHHDRGLTDVADVQFASMPAGACDCRGLLHDMGQGQHNSDQGVQGKGVVGGSSYLKAILVLFVTIYISSLV